MSLRRAAIGLCGLAAAIGGLAAIGHAAGFQINNSDSAPKGLWRVTSLDPAQVRHGSLISICPPKSSVVGLMFDRGYLPAGDCPNGTAAFLKPVVATQGDRVTVTAAGIAVNGQMLPNSAAVAGMPAMNSGSYAVQAGHVWLVSSFSAGSFDSRYFGPVSLANLRGTARPVFVRGDISFMTKGTTNDAL